MNNYFGTMRTPLPIICICVVFLYGFITFCTAKLPDDLPGEEITEDQYFDFLTPRDSVAKKVPKTSPESPTWLDKASKTWDAPPTQVQIAQDKEKMLMGMGAVYIPYMSDPNLEPEVEIFSTTGKVVASGKTGKKFSLMPNKYYALLGSGAHKQKIVKPIIIEENKIIPFLPDWCGLSIDVVDKNNYPFRGEYELARIDKFVPFGRAFGRDPDLGEKVKTWILKPGVYKIFGVGQGYNTLTNFVTVRLLPGEFTRFILVQDENTMEIKGGGVVQMEASSEIASNWKYGLDIGGGIDFNTTYDHQSDSTTKNETSLSLIFRSQLKYKKEKIDWENRLRLSEEVRISNWDWLALSNSVDELQLRSTFTWHFLTWFGPYGRFEINTELFPEYERSLGEDEEKHCLVIFDEDYRNPVFNSSKVSYKLQPPFSPLSLEPGVGANVTMPKTRYVEAKMLSGLGLKYNKVWDESEIIFDTSDIDFNELDSLDSTHLAQIFNNDTNYTLIRRFNDHDDIEVGPEIILTLLFKLGRFGTIESELKCFSPFDRMERPDLNMRTTVSWRLLRMLTLDYEYEYKLKQHEDEALQQDESRHRVLVRFSFITR